MRLNEAGEIVNEVWLALPDRYPRITLDAYVVMPDHFHGIVTIGPPDISRTPDDARHAAGPAGHAAGPAGHVGPVHEPALRVTPDHVTPDHVTPDHVTPDHVTPDHIASTGAGSSPQERRRMLLPLAMGYFKMNSAKRINRLSGRTGALWQEDYYEHIIRTERALRNIRRYIDENPRKWWERWG